MQAWQTSTKKDLTQQQDLINTSFYKLIEVFYFSFSVKNKAFEIKHSRTQRDVLDVHNICPNYMIFGYTLQI